MATRGWEGVKPGEIALRTAKKRGKYGSKKTVVDGVEFDSKKEAKRYHELKLMQQAGQIWGLRLQPRYALFACVLDGADVRDANAGKFVHTRHVVCEYVADFEYETFTDKQRFARTPFGRVVVEDVKSPATRKKEVYRLKRKLFEAQYGVPVREV